MTTTILFDIAPVGAGIGIFLGVAFFFICAAIAFIAYKMLKRTVKMAVRLVIVAVILLVAFVGSLSLLMFGLSGKGPVRQIPNTQRPR